MDMNRLTQKSIEVLQAAQSLAVKGSNQAVDQQHVLAAMLHQENGLIAQLIDIWFCATL